MKKRITTHPGAILDKEYLVPLNISARKLAGAIDVPANRITKIIRQERSLTPDTALRLAKYFGTTPGFWMNLQINYDLSKAAIEAAKDISKIKALETIAA